MYSLGFPICRERVRKPSVFVVLVQNPLGYILSNSKGFDLQEDTTGASVHARELIPGD